MLSAHEHARDRCRRDRERGIEAPIGKDRKRRRQPARIANRFERTQRRDARCRRRVGRRGQRRQAFNRARSDERQPRHCRFARGGAARGEVRNQAVDEF
jgi:hypothetical protein